MTKHCRVESSFSCDLSLSLSSLLATSSLCDCSLVCSDGQLSAHKVILAATSSFFSTVFNQFHIKHHNHPLIYLRGINTSQMKSVLDFLYSGSVNVAEEEVKEFLAVANDLQIEGLMVKNKKTPTSKKNKASGKVSLNEEGQNKQENNTEDFSNEKEEDTQNDTHSLENFEEQEDISDTEISILTKNGKYQNGAKVSQSKKRKGKDIMTSNKELLTPEKKKKKLDASTINQNSLPRLNIPPSHTSTSLTTMLPATFHCPICKTRVVSSLKSHMEFKHKTRCQDCKLSFDSCNALHQHKRGNCQAINLAFGGSILKD